MSITRRNHGGGHSYYDDTVGEKVRGVTTILRDAMPKPALVDWAGRTTAAYAIDYWDELATLPPSKRLQRLDRCRYKQRDDAARLGGRIHLKSADLVAGREVSVPDEEAGHIEAYIAFLDTWKVEPVLVETIVANRQVHYCGTLDLIADLHGPDGETERWLIDIKTSRSGIFPETALQCCAYARAEVYLDQDGNEQSVAELGIQRVGGLHVRADGWDLRELDWSEQVWNFFRHLAWLQRRLEESKGWVGPALEVPRAAEAAS